jgi:hypothetical protein
VIAALVIVPRRKPNRSSKRQRRDRTPATGLFYYLLSTVPLSQAKDLPQPPVVLIKKLPGSDQ